VRGHNLASVRAHNRGATVRLLSQNGALSRRQIAQRSGLNASTITHIVNDFLRAGLGLRVVLDHHACAMALAEQWFGHARQTRDFAFVRVDSSIGVGLVIDGQLLRGDGARAAGPTPASLTSVLRG
jgi:predicted NBD/HSP70 family sugar kinase